ncbi:hypothetical protein BP6252_06908 [Coleophoma cylindrospora]|uniref:Mid2 domain-containing protein n=1 Tax=Coleophoma cylindrospora TaxID=1849047 RepID=A0A3D8RGK7_9HELO|nr:hypothetical protein BP6252_06908 [Coleophoma cylindrospora]
MLQTRLRSAALAMLTWSWTTVALSMRSTVARQASEVLQVCHNNNGTFAPFCRPENGTVLFVGRTYYITWDPSYFAATEGINATVLIMANYINSTGQVAQASSSPITENSQGYIPWTITHDWVKDFSSNNVTLFITPLNAASGTDGRTVEGPRVTVTTAPFPDHPHHRPDEKSPNHALAIALPIVLGFLAICAIAAYLIHRKRGIRNMLGKGTGYGVRKSRAQRVGKAENAIQLQDHDLGSGMKKNSVDGV